MEDGRNGFGLSGRRDEWYRAAINRSRNAGLLIAPWFVCASATLRALFRNQPVPALSVLRPRSDEEDLTTQLRDIIPVAASLAASLRFERPGLRLRIRTDRYTYNEGSPVGTLGTATLTVRSRAVPDLLAGSMSKCRITDIVGGDLGPITVADPAIVDARVVGSGTRSEVLFTLDPAWESMDLMPDDIAAIAGLDRQTKASDVAWLSRGWKPVKPGGG